MRALARHLELVLSGAAQDLLADHGLQGQFQLTVEDFDPAAGAWPVVVSWTDGAPVGAVQNVLSSAHVSFQLAPQVAAAQVPLLILPWRELSVREQIRALYRQLPAGAEEVCTAYREACAQIDPADDERELLFVAFDDLTGALHELLDAHDPTPRDTHEDRWVDTAEAFLAAHPHDGGDLMLPISDTVRDILLLVSGPNRATVDALV